MNFLKSKTFLLLLLLLAITAIVYLLLRPKPGLTIEEPRPQMNINNCFTITRDDMVNSWLGPNWNVKGDPNYISGIMFEAIDTDPNNIKIVAYPVDNSCNPVEGKQIEINAANPAGAKCSFNSLKAQKTRYDFASSDIDPFGDLIHFNFMRLIPKPDATNPANLSFVVEYVKIKGGSETVLSRGDTKPCPPYCPTDPDLIK
ncbi:MAG TPA: hypothetical protein PK092_12585 [Chitinophagaceae bacterium]|nr:hypothetical protein [Chitinophagaceae bacterium]